MKKVVVVGGGPAGYVSAIRAAQLGGEVHLVENGKLGGTCLNVGCIPTKVLLLTADLYRLVRCGKVAGLKTEKTEMDWPELLRHKQAVIGRLVKGVEGLLKATKIVVHQGIATLKDSRTVEIEGARSQKLTADVVVMAPGSAPLRLNFPGADLPKVIDSTAALELPQVPGSLVIIGGGVLGLEFGALFGALGTQVTIVEMLPEILPGLDREVVAAVKREMVSRGIKFLTGSRIAEVSRASAGLTVKTATGDTIHELPADYVLVAAGRVPSTENIGLEKAGIEKRGAKIAVDENFRTNVPGIYAAGDCNGELMLAHAASAQGIAAVEHALVGHANYHKNTIPSCIYTSPEVAYVGWTEEEAKRHGVRYKTGVFPLAANGKACIEDGSSGLIKIVTGAKYGEILGVHIYGPRATELIAEAALSVRLEATADELVSTIHPHPTISEAMGEAALAVNGSSIHYFRRPSSD